MWKGKAVHISSYYHLKDEPEIPSICASFARANKSFVASTKNSLAEFLRHKVTRFLAEFPTHCRHALNMTSGTHTRRTWRTWNAWKSRANSPTGVQQFSCFETVCSTCITPALTRCATASLHALAQGKQTGNVNLELWRKGCLYRPYFFLWLRSLGRAVVLECIRYTIHLILCLMRRSILFSIAASWCATRRANSCTVTRECCWGTNMSWVQVEIGTKSREPVWIDIVISLGKANFLAQILPWACTNRSGNKQTNKLTN